MQLIRPGVEMLDPIKQKPIGPAEVMEKFGVTPDKMIDVQALIGDSTDNVPGVPGIGPKGAAQLINEFGDLESVLAAAPAMKPSKRRDNLIEHADKARISRELVTLRTDTPMPLPVDQLHARAYDKATLARLAEDAGVPQHRHAAGAGRRGGRRRLPTTVEAAPRPRAGGTAAAPSRPSRRTSRRASVRMRRSPPRPRCAISWRRSRPAASSPSTPRPTGWMRCARRWSDFRLRSRRDAPPIVPLRHEGLAEQVPLAAAIAALGPVLTDRGCPEDLSERQVRHAGDGACGLPAVRAVRRYDADLLRPGGRHARPRAGRAVAAASRPYADQLRRGHRHRAQPHSVLGRCRSSAPPPMRPRTPM